MSSHSILTHPGAAGAAGDSLLTGIVFVLTLLVAYLFWRWQMLRAGHDREMTDSFVLWGTVATLVGARLGHCFFYDP